MLESAVEFHFSRKEVMMRAENGSEVDEAPTGRHVRPHNACPFACLLGDVALFEASSIKGNEASAKARAHSSGRL